MTDKYLHVHYYAAADDFIYAITGKELVAIDNVDGSQPLSCTKLPKNAVLLFGAERSGIRQELLQHAVRTIAIEQFGSTRSLNVGVAAGIAMYAWVQQHRLQ